MSDVNCPFDGDFCQRKQDQFDEWSKFVFKTQSIVFQTNGKIFADCPETNNIARKDMCNRYRRYLFIVENVKKELQKQNEQR